MFDAKKAEADARKELATEQAELAKTKIKAHLKKIAAAQQVLVNLDREYEAMLREIGADVG